MVIKIKHNESQLINWLSRYINYRDSPKWEEEVPALVKVCEWILEVPGWDMLCVMIPQAWYVHYWWNFGFFQWTKKKHTHTHNLINALVMHLTCWCSSDLDSLHSV